ncbi:hypothetical protein RASY3_09475 [Ruminococcus albus SY3]|uniref:SMEK domain-containing protein n=1 Tax=Ruminococcus albus SY3 TaxID=1341156 RepID=A0A011WTD4_RUMAL|nr:SMEK domain-containing protein [Ruminococcus albus]EXM40295.1 hypothetical protein RASY3_09475 [Ruminococcus albus SY3]
MKQEELIKTISELLYKLCDLIESRNTLNYYDINISSEYFFIPLLNLVFDCNLKNINTDEKNAAAIDLYDSNGKIAIQVTSNSSADKIRTTLNKYRKNKLYDKYQRLVVVVIVRSHTYRADFTDDIDGKFVFSTSNDIYTINSLIKAIQALSIEKIARVKEYLEYQLDILFDRSQVLNIEQSFNYISKNTDNILNEAFFEIDDERFIDDFKKKLDDSSIIHLFSISVEEGRYCILNLLHKLKPDIPVYIVKSKETWNETEKFLFDCILIPDFQAEEIPAVENNTTIFIHNENTRPNALRIPQRTIRFLSDKLRNNGYDDPYKLLHKTNGLYYYIRNTLFTGTQKHPSWEKDNDKAVIVAALFGKWKESDGDKSLIEKLYGNSYEQFIAHLNQYIGVEDAYIVRKRDMSYNVIYELADPFLAICSHRNAFTSSIIIQFFDITKEFISERDPIFDEPFERHFYLSAFKKSKYSNSIKSGMTRTLILLALYADYQNEISNLVKEILKMIQSISDWAYISQYIESLCEAAPDAVIAFIENNIDNHTGLLDLFTVEKSGFLTGRHYYTNILWCLERLLPCKDYVARVVRILFEMGNNIEKCSTGNNPRDDISKVFCTWYNVSALEIEEKIELAKIGVEKYPFFWDSLYKEISKNTSILCDLSFIYRETDKIIPYTNGDVLRFSVSYAKILIANISDNLNRIISLIDLLPTCTDEIFIAIQNKMKTAVIKLADPDKEQIKTQLRKIIYHHRRFAKSNWASSSERISKIEKICLDISFEDPAYDFLYLTESGNIPILNPIVYESEEESHQKNKNHVNEVIASEIARFKESNIDLGHFLGLRKIDYYTTIGATIAKYYCNMNYEESILFSIISSTDNPQIAVNYVRVCSDSALTEVYSALEALRDKHYADKFYIAFLLALPFDEKTRLLIFSLPPESAKMYWQMFSRFESTSKELLDDVIKNLIKFSNWCELYYAIFEHESMFTTDEVLAIILDSIKKIISEEYNISNNESSIIKQLLSIIYQRIGDDFESYPILFQIEMRLSGVLMWDNMKCCQYLFKHNANIYADIIALVYKKDDGLTNESIDTDKFQVFISLEQDIKFCPGEEKGSINKEILNTWLNTFCDRLDSQGQGSLKYKKIGKLFACSPMGEDGLFPHEAIRDKIEVMANEELISSFASSVLYDRGLFTVTWGKDEYKLGQKYAELSRKLSVRYPKTAKIFRIISKSFLRESELDREIAETDII